MEDINIWLMLSFIYVAIMWLSLNNIRMSIICIPPDQHAFNRVYTALKLFGFRSVFFIVVVITFAPVFWLDYLLYQLNGIEDE